MNIFLIITACLTGVAGYVWWRQFKSPMPNWQRLYLFIIDNTEKSDVYLKDVLSDRYGITGYKAKFLISAGRKHDQETFKSLVEMPNSNEPLN
jgi:hypothetical protein